MSSFTVLYSKDALKKRKAYQDGIFNVKKAVGDSFSFTLCDESGSEIKRVTDKMNKYNVITGTEFMFGIYSVQIESEIGSADVVGHDAKETAPETKQSKVVKKPFVQSIQKFSSNSLNVQSSIQSKPFSFHKPPQSLDICFDPSLMKVLRPHQVLGATFLLEKLTIANFGLEDEDDTFKGAILADEMGLGKTLTSIAVLWAFVRTGHYKGVVVCPSSLIDNWDREMRQWLGVKLKPLCIRPGVNNAEHTINSFVIGHGSLTPVLILSYEMFRKHATLINTVPNLEVLVCDEGHRLKNVGGTKTIEALSGCRARRRIVLSGTPIQNDLEELYAVVSFVKPNFLGSLPSFKSRISDPIVRGSEPDASEAAREEGEAASQQLRQLMSKLMLRRTQGDILSKSLPPRSDYVVFCRLTLAQQEQYWHTVHSINSAIGRSTPGSLQQGSSGDLMLQSEEQEEAEEDNGSLVNSSAVLPGLQQLRKICVFSSDEPVDLGAASENNPPPEVNRQSGTASIAGLNSKFVAPSSSAKPSLSAARPHSRGTLGASNALMTGSVGLGGSRLSVILSSSAKFQFLVSLMSSLQVHAARQGAQQEKVVLVSNFTSTLDQVQALAAAKGWGDVLRIDGKVPVDKRQGLVDSFNRPSDRRLLFLLSSKAGGVGINLIGGSRLVMFDPDWNPATDKQAMSRIWREGQKRPVFIYRLVAHECIEEAILNRQFSKSGLAGALTAGDEAEDGAASLESFAGCSSGKAPRMSLTRRDLQQLMTPDTLPCAGEERGEQEDQVSGNSGDSSGNQGLVDSLALFIDDDPVLWTACDKLKNANVIARVEKRSAEFY